MQILKFSVDSALLSELGEKLVESVHVALVELIKNSYDADAKNVYIKFVPSIFKGPEITIIDDGKGMAFENVKKYWMRIATTNKVDNQVSEIYGRPQTGSKGIGRFSCRRLGNVLKLKTTGKNSDGKFETTEVDFNWKEFEPGGDVTSVDCKGKLSIHNQGETGTTLTISNRDKDEWTQRGYGYLLRQLAVLVANRGIKRKGFIEDPGFRIKFNAPQYESDEIIDLREKLIDAGWGTITAEVNEKGYAVCKLEAIRIGKKEITSSMRFNNLKGIKMRLGIMVDSREQMRDKDVLSIGTLNDILKDWGGVQVKYNGFRVYPYGNDDWLDIDKERGLRKGNIEGELEAFASTLKGVDPKRAKLSMLSMHSYIGSVEISSKAKGFEMKANREGFVYSPSISELKNFVRFAIDWSTIFRDFYLRTKKRGEAEVAKAYLELALGEDILSAEIVEKATEYLNREIKSIIQYIPEDQQKKIKHNLKLASDALIKHDYAFRNELNHLRLISSTSILLLVFTHEVKSLISEIEISKSVLKNIEKKLSGKDFDNVSNIRQNIDKTKQRLLDLINMTSLIGIESKNAIAVELSVKDSIEEVKKCFSLIISNYDISLNIDNVPNNLKTGPILEAELYSILLNVLSNSIKSVIAEGKDKNIEISASREKSKLTIIIRDTGIGLDKSNYDDVFIPFLSDPQGKLYKNLFKKINPEDKYFIGTGSGLGLSIIKEIIKSRNGSIRFEEPEKNWKSKLIIILP